MEQDQVFLLNRRSLLGRRRRSQGLRRPLQDSSWSCSTPRVTAHFYPPTDYIFGAFSSFAICGRRRDHRFRGKAPSARRKIAYINHDDAYGVWNLEGSKADAAAHKVDLLVESISPTITDVTAPFFKLRAANPDAIAIVTYARPAAS